MAINEPLKDIFKNIRNELQQKLENSAELSEIREVIYGERARIGSLRTPAIWIVPNPHAPELRGGHTASHDFTFDFVALVKEYDPQKGLQKAHDFSMDIYDVIAADRTLNGLVHDVRPTLINPAYEAGESTQVYWSAVQFAFRLQRRE